MFSGSVSAQGADGNSFNPVSNSLVFGEAGDQGSAGGFGQVQLAPGTAGGSGGNGGSGGSGGFAGRGGDGGGGGGGAGGTILFRGAQLDGSAGTASVVGGQQNGDGAFASVGRIVVADSVTNTDLVAATSGSLEVFSGAGGEVLNPFFLDGPVSTPNVIGLEGGADGFGIQQNVDADDNFFANINLNAPSDAVAAIFLSDETPLGQEYDGHLSLSLINLSSLDLSNVGLGITTSNDSLTTTGLQTRGFENNPAFGGGGAKTLQELGEGDVYTTLVPDSTFRFNFTASGLSLSETLSQGAFTFLRSSGGLLGDFDLDGDVDADDIDFFNGNLDLAATGTLTQLDLDDDGEVTLADHDAHVTNLVQTSNGQTGALIGDIDLDGQVNVLGDGFILVSNLNTNVSSYSEGDLNADGLVNVLGDGFRLVSNLGQNNNPSSLASLASAVPEPSNMSLFAIAGLLTTLRRRKNARTRSIHAASHNVPDSN